MTKYYRASNGKEYDTESELFKAGYEMAMRDLTAPPIPALDCRWGDPEYIAPPEEQERIAAKLSERCNCS